MVAALIGLLLEVAVTLVLLGLAVLVGRAVLQMLKPVLPDSMTGRIATLAVVAGLLMWVAGMTP